MFTDHETGRPDLLGALREYEQYGGLYSFIFLPTYDDFGCGVATACS